MCFIFYEPFLLLNECYTVDSLPIRAYIDVGLSTLHVFILMQAADLFSLSLVRGAMVLLTDSGHQGNPCSQVQPPPSQMAIIHVSVLIAHYISSIHF